MHLSPRERSCPAADREPAVSRFLCGASTASHQVEGGNRHNDWWDYEQAGRLPFQSGDACRHFDLYEEDFDLARSLGHNAHRFSIEWSRIEPDEGQWSQSALSHYLRVIDALVERGIEPVVTLHHFTNPAWFTRTGGWTKRSSVDRFRRYVDFVAPQLCGRVRYFLTINEPTVYVKRAYVAGDWPPCHRGSWLGGLLAMRNQCRAHVVAYDALHAHRPDAMVGFAHSAPHVEAKDPGRASDRMVAALRDFAMNGLPFALLGRRPRRVLDFIGLNYYTRQRVAWHPHGAAMLFGAECKEQSGSRHRTFNSLGWEVYPAGLRFVLRRFARYGLPLMVTENGIATDDEHLRDWFVAEHLRALDEARSDGLPVCGYFYWSLMDNFEWTEGFNARFGLAAVDFESQRREVRPAGERFREYCMTHRSGTEP